MRVAGGDPFDIDAVMTLVNDALARSSPREHRPLRRRGPQPATGDRARARARRARRRGRPERGRARASPRRTRGEAVDFADAEAVAEVGRRARRRRRHDVRRRPRRADRRARRRAARPAGHRLRGRASRDEQDRDAARVRRARRAAAAVRGACATTRGATRPRATIGFPAVLKPADSAGQRGIFLVHDMDELARRCRSTLAASPSEEAIVEQFHDGPRGEHAARRARRRRPADHRVRPHPSGGHRLRRRARARLSVDALRRRARGGGARRARRGARDRPAQRDRVPAAARLADGNEVRVVEIAARIPGGQMVEVPRYGVGIDLVEVAVQAGARRAGARRARDAAASSSRRDPLPHRGARAAADRRRAERSARSTRRSPSRASSAPRRGSSPARRSGPCRRTATGAAT